MHSLLFQSKHFNIQIHAKNKPSMTLSTTIEIGIEFDNQQSYVRQVFQNIENEQDKDPHIWSHCNKTLFNVKQHCMVRTYVMLHATPSADVYRFAMFQSQPLEISIVHKAGISINETLTIEILTLFTANSVHQSSQLTMRLSLSLFVVCSRSSSSHWDESVHASQIIYRLKALF